MHLQRHIKQILLVGCIFFSLNVFAQRDTIGYVKSPYRAEYNPYFSLTTFKRGFSTDSLKLSLDSLESKSRNAWSRKDSLRFAQISLRTGNLALSEYYFDHLNVDLESEESFWFDHLMVHYLKKQFKQGLVEINVASPMIIEFSKMYFFKKIFEAQIEQQKNKDWYKTNIVFGWTTDTLLLAMDRKSKEFKNAVTDPLLNLESVLKHIISYVYDNDPVLAASCREMGHIIYGYFGLSQAYIAYSMAHHYNKKDKAIMEEMAYVKSRLNQKKYKVPNFRKYFPRIEKGRFEYDVLKEKVIFAQNDTNVYVVPPTMKPPKKPLISFPHQLIVLGGIALMIILLVIILKPRKK